MYVEFTPFEDFDQPPYICVSVFQADLDDLIPLFGEEKWFQWLYSCCRTDWNGKHVESYYTPRRRTS